MDEPTKNLALYIKSKKISLRQLSIGTEIEYMTLYNCLRSKTRHRSLRAGELIRICRYLKINPMDFA